MKDPEIRLTGHNVSVMVAKDRKMVGIRWLEVVPENDGYALSGREALLQLTVDQAMRLMVFLQKAQQDFDLPLDDKAPHRIDVPAANKRN